MKVRNILLLLILIMVESMQATTHVVSFGISQYPDGAGWCRINSDNDIELIKQTFRTTDLLVLENNAATKKHIINTLKSLCSRLSIGDTVIIHFSGHGQQILTENAKEEADGIDEAIIPYDACRKMSEHYKGENHLTDDEFGELITSFSTKLGKKGLVVAVLDACHSGSMDKATEDSDEIYRGTDDIFGSEKLSASEIEKIRKIYNTQETDSIRIDEDMSNIVFIGACKSNQRNYEIKIGEKGYGSLTYYFCKTYQDNKMTDTETFLTKLYNAMTCNHTLKFHGQEPKIKNSLGWIEPLKEEVVQTPPLMNNDSKISIYLVIGSVTGFILIIMFLWKKMK